MYLQANPYLTWGFTLFDDQKGPWDSLVRILGGGAAALLGKELLSRWRPSKEKQIDADERFLETVMARVGELENKLDTMQEEHRATMARVHAEYESRILNYRAELHACRGECQRLMAEAIRRGYDPDAPISAKS